MRARTQDKHNISSFQQYLGQLYSLSNKELSQEYMYSYLCRSIGYLCKNLSAASKTPLYFIRPISWLFAIGSKLDIDVQESFVGRYPRICPSCLQCPCVCFKTNKQPPSYMPAYKVVEELYWKKQSIMNEQIKDSHKLTLDYAAQTIQTLYPNNEIIWHYGGPWYHFSKLQEELAETHEAMASFFRGLKGKEAVATEIADVFAWTIGMWPIIMPTYSLDGEFISYYINGCPTCKSNPCLCKAYSSRPEGHIDIKAIVAIRDNLNALAQLMPSNQSAIEDVIKSLGVAVDTKDDSIARLSVKQTASKLANIKDKISNVDDIGRKSFSIIETVLKIIERLT